jgi:Tfp pilus assembly protein PilP
MTAHLSKNRLHVDESRQEMVDETKMQINRDEALGITVWIDTQSQSVSIGLEESWYVRSVVSLPFELSEPELGAQVGEELQIQFPAETSDWLFDYVALNQAPPIDGLRAWEIFALASKHMESLHNICREKRWRLVCVAPISMLAQAQMGHGAYFYPSRQQRMRQLWRKRCIQGGVGLGIGLLLFLGLGPGYSLANAYWSGAPQPPLATVQAKPIVANTPKIEPWMEKELSRMKEPLENFNLEDLRAVGFIQQERSSKALILVKGQQSLGIHSVRLGDRLGKNFGRVLQITDSAVLLQELHLDGSGEWIERKTSLQVATDAT